MYIRIITYIENWIGKRIYQTHCIPLDNPKQMTLGVSNLIDFSAKQIPTLLSVEIIDEREKGQTKSKER